MIISEREYWIGIWPMPLDNKQMYKKGKEKFNKPSSQVSYIQFSCHIREDENVMNLTYKKWEFINIFLKT